MSLECFVEDKVLCTGCRLTMKGDVAIMGSIHSRSRLLLAWLATLGGSTDVLAPTTCVVLQMAGIERPRRFHPSAEHAGQQPMNLTEDFTTSATTATDQLSATQGNPLMDPTSEGTRMSAALGAHERGTARL